MSHSLTVRATSLNRASSSEEANRARPKTIRPNPDPARLQALASLCETMPGEMTKKQKVRPPL